MRRAFWSAFPGGRPRTGDGHWHPLSSAGGSAAGEAEGLRADGADEVLRALTAPARVVEVTAFDQVMAEYRDTVLTSSRRSLSVWRPIMMPSVVGAKLGATLAGFAVGLAGAGVAAYTGSLPPSLQNAAHAAIGAPAAPPSDASTPAPGTTKDDPDGVGPDATGPAAHGLCNAWSQHQRNGAKPTESVAFRNLAKAAGGESKIAAYCATIPHPHQGHGAANGGGNGKGKGNGKGDDKGSEKGRPGKEKGLESSPGTPTIPTPTSTGRSSTPRATPSTATPTPTSTARSTTATPSTTTTSSTSTSTSSP